jgi:hypothetical protein
MKRVDFYTQGGEVLTKRISMTDDNHFIYEGWSESAVNDMELFGILGLDEDGKAKRLFFPKDGIEYLEAMRIHWRSDYNPVSEVRDDETDPPKPFETKWAKLISSIALILSFLWGSYAG